MRTRLSIVVSVVLTVATSLAQVPAVKSAVIDAPQLLKDLEILSADDMQGRRVGTPDALKRSMT